MFILGYQEYSYYYSLRREDILIIYWLIIISSLPLFFLSSKKWLYIPFLIVFLSAFSAFQAIDVSKDREEYLNFFKFFSENTSENIPFAVEPFFFIIYKLFNYTLETQVFAFFLVCFIGLSIKLYLIKEMSPNIKLSVLVFLSYLFLLQDMNQIRVGVALGVIYLSLSFFYKKEYFKWLFFALIAMLFHFSAVLALLAPTYVFRNISQTKLLVALILIFLFSIFWLYLGGAVKIVGVIASVEPTGKLTWYINHSVSDAINPIKRLLPHVIFLIPILLKYNLIYKKYPQIEFFAPLYLMYIISFIILSPIPTLAYRISDIFLFSSVFVLPSLFLVIKQKFIANVVIVSFALFQFIYVVYVLNYFGSYNIIFNL